ncbi:MAG: ABC transporter permease, partial [Clostridiales bacterium]|nr:ABC transporter permease [Clostridiales bacterium]
VPEFYPYNYSRQDVTAKNLKPFQYSAKELVKIDKGESVFPHIMGTDSLGRDYAIRVIYGTRISLLVGMVSAFIVVVIGVLYGSISGFFGGRVDMVMMRLVDIIYSLPDVLIVILLSVAIKDSVNQSSSQLIVKLGAGMVSIFIVFGLLYWVGMARQVRGQVLSIKEQEYVLASRSIGASPTRIIRKHMIPNAISVIIITAAMQIPSAIFTESFLSFLGLGVSMPMPSLGSLASDARVSLRSYPHLLVFPALSIFLIVLSFNLLGTGLRDAFDPKLRS